MPRFTIELQTEEEIEIVDLKTVLEASMELDCRFDAVVTSIKREGDSNGPEETIRFERKYG